MSRNTTLVVRALIVGVAFSTLSLAAASPAGAHTNSLFSYETGEPAGNFVSFDKAAGAKTALPTPSDLFDVEGLKIVGEVGAAITFDPTTNYSVTTWDHTSGAVISSVPVSVSTGSTTISLLEGLDALPDGRLITYAEWRALDSSFEHQIVIVDPTTGVMTPLVDYTALVTPYRLFDIATDPISGVTYVFASDTNTNIPYAIAVDVATGTFGDPIAFTGDTWGPGNFGGADFDASGTLYFFWGNTGGDDDTWELSSLGGTTTWNGGAVDRTILATYPVDAPGIQGYALAAESATAPALANTGLVVSPAWLVAGGVALLGGVLLVTARRRRNA